LLRLVLQVVISVVPARIVAEVQASLRTSVFGAFTRASWTEQSRDREGHLQETLTIQVTQSTVAVVNAATLVVALVAFLVLLASALTLNVVAALLVLVAATGLFGVLRPLNRVGDRAAHATAEASAGFAGGVSEAVRIAVDTQVFGTGGAITARTDELVAQLTPAYFWSNFIARLVPGVYQSLIYLLVVGALGVLYLMDAGQVASLTAVVLLLVRAGMYGQQAQAAYLGVRQMLPYVERLQEAEQKYRASSPVSGDRPLSAVRSLRFEDVSFAYEPRRPVLSSISFEVAGGEAIGIIGPSGAGKSTLIQLLLGLRAPSTGSFLVNGITADQFKREHWHARVAYVSQEPSLIHASVSENIRFFRSLDDAAVERAARLAGIHDEVLRWSSGYETLIGPRADAISGGQQQRICLARALAAEPEVLVLDEPTSALDPHAEFRIQESLASLKDQLTLFVVAHRMSTLDICGRVMVIVDGSLQAFDEMEKLHFSSAYYRSVVGGRTLDQDLRSVGHASR
jgi:ABC-type multidrug transport system fused ATPase/permease subunit